MNTVSKATLMIVDDEAEIREMLERHFSFEGFKIKLAANGQEALDILSECKIDIIISDIVMPKMSGVQLLEKISKEFAMVRVIMITGYVTQSHLLQCMKRHADDVIYKPLDDLTELEESVKRSVSNIQRWKDKLKILQGMKLKSV